MNESSNEYLVLSRGQWDKDTSQADIEIAIGKFYDWLTRCIDGGKMKMGSRLSRDRAVVSKSGIVTDGPFGESKEVIGGYWIIVARNLAEAAALAAQNPCLQHGLTFEIRPLEAERASVYKLANETPAPRAK
ncbi:MAG: hypothetical protein JWM68_5131 [Verrucomicrobiales bacterium]|nr:hypothetical protein [Verrucomicrobiales bacterium]